MAKTKETPKESKLVGDLRTVEGAYIANQILSNSGRNDASAPVAASYALSEITRYTADNPMSSVGTKYLGEDLKKFSESGNKNRGVIVKATGIVKEAYDDFFKRLTFRELAQYRGSILEILPDEIKAKGLELLTGENASKTINQFNDEKAQAKMIKDLSTSTPEQRDMADAILEKHDEFEKFINGLGYLQNKSAADNYMSTAKLQELTEALSKL